MTYVNSLAGQKSSFRSSFKQRALGYWKLDQQLSRQTRFFGAAALTNTALYELSSPMGRYLAGSCVQGFLWTLGAHLHTINQQNAHLIAEGARMAPSVDVAMVTIEQQAVQDELNALGAQDCAFFRIVISEVDFLLNSGWLRIMGKSSPAVCTYLKILRRVRSQVGGRIHFVCQNHREAIGFAVIGFLSGPDKAHGNRCQIRET